MKMRSKLWIEEVIAKLSNWTLVRLGEPPVFSTKQDQEPRYWRELRQYLKMLPMRVSGKIPPIPLREISHTELHPYRANRLGPIETKLLDACYMDPYPTTVLTQEQWDECYNEAVSKDKDVPKGSWESIESKEADDASRKQD